jgi:hypothetical protein
MIALRLLFERSLLVTLGVAQLLVAAACGLAWYNGYWVIRDCVEAAWRGDTNNCYAPEWEGTTSGWWVIFIGPAIFLLTRGLAFLWFGLKPHRKRAQ